MPADEGAGEVRLGHRGCKRGNVERARDSMGGGSHSELMHSNIFAIKPKDKFFRHPLNLNSSPHSISVHVDESGHRISF